jgi:hypothetical protein
VFDALMTSARHCGVRSGSGVSQEKRLSTVAVAVREPPRAVVDAVCVADRGFGLPTWNVPPAGFTPQIRSARLAYVRCSMDPGIATTSSKFTNLAGADEGGFGLGRRIGYVRMLAGGLDRKRAVDSLEFHGAGILSVPI